MSLFSWVANQFQTNQMLVGLVGATIAGTVTYSLKAVPAKIWSAFLYFFTVTMTLHSEDDVYGMMSAWLARENKANNSRELMMTENYDYSQMQWTWSVTIGTGWHVIWHKGSIILINRVFKDEGGLGSLFGGRRRGDIVLRTIGRSQQPIRDLIQAARDLHEGTDTLKVHYWDGKGYILIDHKYKRSLDTIFMDEETKARILNDMREFCVSKEVYRSRGTPYRRGYCFFGQPGTGKSTLIAAFAGAINRSIYIINLSQVGGDAGLQSAVNGIGPNGFGVIEDIDTHEVVHKRKAAKADDDLPRKGSVSTKGLLDEKKKERREGELTLGGVLNAFDGIASREGRMLAITTNRLETLDPALLRPGRFGLIEEVKALDETVARRMYKAYFPDASEEWWFDQHVVPLLPLGASALEEKYLTRGKLEPRLSLVA
jgi:chaperone BCS1